MSISRSVRVARTYAMRLGLAALVACTTLNTAHAAKPLPPLPWDAIARTSEPIIVKDWLVLSNGEVASFGFCDGLCTLKPAVVCIDDQCWAMGDGPVWQQVEPQVVGKRWPPARWAALIGPPAATVVGLGMTQSDIVPVAATGAVMVLWLGIATFLTPVLVLEQEYSPGSKWRDNAVVAGPFLSSEVTAFLRQRYESDRRAYLSLRDQFQACTLSNEAPLQAPPAARAAARASCDTYRTELAQNPRLADPFAEALSEANAAAVAWDSVPMLQRLASGDYLGFYQARETLPMKALPAPVAQDVCDRVRDATGGKAIADALLRTKLSAWASETCSGGE